MDGPNSTSGNIPNTTSHPVTPSKPSSPNQPGVNPLDGQRYTPDSGSRPAGISIHMRNPRVQPGVLPKVNREKAVEQLRSSYKEHYAQAEAKRDQLDLAHSLKDIRHYLDNPALAKECTSYSIMWIPDEGEPISVIPPGTELNDRAKAAEVRGMLHGQLDKLEQKFTVTKLQQLEEEIGQQDGLMKLAAQQLQQLGEPLPDLPPRERIVLLGGTSSKGVPVTGQSPVSMPLPGTGQHTQPSPGATPGAVPTPATQPKPSRIPAHHPGQFELRFKNPATPPLPTPVFETDDLSEEEPPLVSFEGNPAPPPATGQRYPGRPLPMEVPFDIPPQERGRLDEEQTLFGSPDQQELAGRPLLDDWDEDLEQGPNDQPPLRTSAPGPLSPTVTPPSPDFARPRPKPSQPVSNTIGPLPTSPFDRVTTSGNPPEFLYTVNYLPAGTDHQHADIFRMKLHLDDDLMASVNSGVPGLGLVDEEQSIGESAGINQRFSKELRHRGDITQYATFHQHMLATAQENLTRYATEQELQQSPGLAASMAFKTDLNGKGKHAGTIIIDVFKDDYPNQNESNQAMIYVVPPDGADYDDPQEYLADCEETAKRLTWSLNQYNLQLFDAHQQGKQLHLKLISTLRTCAFGSGASRHPGVTPSDVADRIARGIDAQLEVIKESGSPQTITQVEFEDGASAIFSKPYTPPPQFDPQTLEPAVVPAPAQPVPPPPPAPPSETAMKLRECSPTLGIELEANMRQLSSEALRSAHPRPVWGQTTNTNPLYNGSLHSSRKAMLTRAMTNFHRKHAEDIDAQTRDARYFPDSALPAIELGVLSTNPVPHAVINGTGGMAQYGNTRDQLIRTNVPEATSSLIATATTGYQSRPKASLLDAILRDVELMEFVRTSPGFDISQLQTYKLYPGASARKELQELCREYYGMLAKQGDLPPSPPKAGSDEPVQLFTLTAEGEQINSGLQRTLNPALRQHLEKNDDWYAQQTSLLKKAGSGLSAQPAGVSPQLSDLPSPGLSPESELQTFGRLYTYTQDVN